MITQFFQKLFGKPAQPGEKHPLDGPVRAAEEKTFTKSFETPAPAPVASAPEPKAVKKPRATKVKTSAPEMKKSVKQKEQPAQPKAKAPKKTKK